MEPEHTAERQRFEELFDAHYAELTRFAARRVGADAAGDVVAATFLVAWRRLADLPTDHPRAWLYATARQIVANEVRGRTRWDRLTAKAAASGETRVEDHSAQVDEQLRVRAVLDSLSPADQELLRLTEWDGLDVAEAALVLRCSRTALKVRLHRARRRFAQRLLATEDRDTAPVRRPSIIAGGSTSS
ncbi:sigma-70 family RNA polymerase sigma factor [Catellatospora sp. KI3]|uniref:RNA polymerase sigma factor n=1 Tax=Catellatospora sp. KI3 TaxID=3041620 RepID=UPI0024823731|nr:sigma-70 family RNA polymerase sigma factor [Catellatospora sp. KI3]MDI1463895.1 sigma-70 family RNA polymerase sigma factor [Catellatospora sp. KI3]